MGCRGDEADKEIAAPLPHRDVRDVVPGHHVVAFCSAETRPNHLRVVRPAVTVGVGPDEHLQRLTGWDEVEVALNPLDGGTSRRAAEAIEPGHVLLIGADAIFGGAVVDAEDHLLVELAIVGDGVVVAIGRDAVGDFTGVDQAIFIAIEILNLATVNFAVVVAVVFIQLALVRNSVLVAVLTLTKVDVTSIRNPVAVAVGIALIGPTVVVAVKAESFGDIAGIGESVLVAIGGAKVVQEEAGW